MTIASSSAALLLLALLLPSAETLAQTSPKHSSSRRSFVAASIGWGLLSGAPSTAHAVKERNEALCGTGFFTNIWQYKCTDIGDIADEGVPKTLSSTEEGATESLMSKLSLGDIEIVDDVPTKEKSSSTTNDSSSKK